MPPSDNRARKEAHSEADSEADSEAIDSSSDVGEAELTKLAVAAQTRDPEATRQFLQAIAPSVRGVCRAVLGSAHADLEDTIQECLMVVLRALPKYRFEGTILHYTNRITLRLAIAARKRGRNREQRVRAFAAEGPLTFITGAQEGLPDLWFLREVLDELSTVQAEAVVMRMVLGYSIEEMAVATDVSVNTSKSRLRAAKDHLRKRLEEEERVGVMGLGGVKMGVGRFEQRHEDGDEDGR